MMMNESIYRLGEYRIIEYDNGQLWWERRFALGVQRRGKCFIHDEILICGGRHCAYWSISARVP